MPSPQFDPFNGDAPDDYVQAVYKYLLTFPDVVSLVGSSDDGVPFLYNGGIYHTMIGTSSCAIVVKHGGSWSVPNNDNTAQFPRVQIEVWSDPPRDEYGNVTRPAEARTRADAVWQQLNGHMHVPFNKVIINNGRLLVYGSVSQGVPVWRQNNSDDKLGTLTGFYGLSMIIGGIDP